MTNDEIRIAIGQHEGLKLVLPPNYLEDLNAVHQLEETLSDAEVQKYIDHLIAVTKADLGYGTNYWSVYHATAPQRCKALLRLWGVWKESR